MNDQLKRKEDEDNKTSEQLRETSVALEAIEKLRKLGFIKVENEVEEEKGEFSIEKSLKEETRNSPIHPDNKVKNSQKNFDKKINKKIDDIKIKEEFSDGSLSDNNSWSDQSEDSSEDSDAVVDKTDRIRMHLPEPFKGIRTADAVDLFISQIKNYCYLTAVPKSARLMLFKSLLVGTAKKWWKSIPKSKRVDMTFKKALVYVRKEFHPELQVENARETLDKLQYYPGKFRQFKDLFRNITFEIKDMSESEKLHVFKKKLPPEFQYEIIRQHCKSVSRAMKITSELDLTRRQAGFYKDEDKRKYLGKEKAKELKNNAVKVEAKKDDKDGKKNVKWVDEIKLLDKVVLNRRRTDGVCLNCGSAEHRVKDCQGPHRRQ
jgi:hypothetical protein